jgi:hypothetical protein
MNMLEPGHESMGRLGGLMKWWGIDGSWDSQSLSALTERTERLISSLREIYADAYHRQLDLMNDANNNFSSRFKDLMGARTPSDAVDAEFNLLKTLAEDISTQCRSYIELSNKLSGCIDDIAQQARTVIDEAQKQGARSTPRQEPQNTGGSSLYRVNALPAND